jgi:hypothetical protein
MRKEEALEKIEEFVDNALINRFIPCESFTEQEKVS